MATSTNNGYRTQVLPGNTRSASECLSILLYNKNTQPEKIPRITLKNIEEVINNLLNSKIEDGTNYIVLSRESSNDVFEYRLEDVREKYREVEGWNIIIYLRKNNRGEFVGIGFTEFINTQGERRDINITLDLTTNVSEDLIVNINYSILNSQPSGIPPLSAVDFLGDEVEDFTFVDKILDYKKTKQISPSLFTTHLSSFGNPKAESNIYMASLGTVVGKEEVMCNFHIAREFDVDPYLVGFTHHYIDYYADNDISVYSWTDDFKYSITSLSLTNRFGDPIRHAGDVQDKGYKEIKYNRNGNPLDPKKSKIKLWCGTYALIEEINNNETSIFIYDTVGEKYIGNSYGNCFIDETNRHNKIVSIPNIATEIEFRKYIPDVQNTWFNFERYGKEFSILARKGDWFIFDLGKWYEFSNLRQSIRIDKSEFENVYLINDLYLGVIERRVDGDTLVVYCGIDDLRDWSWKTTKVLNTQDSEEEYKPAIPPGGMKPTPDFELQKHFTAKRDGVIKEIRLDDTLDKTWFRYFKKNSYPLLRYPKINEFVGSCSGIMFFLFENEETRKKILNYI